MQGRTTAGARAATTVRARVRVAYAHPARVCSAPQRTLADKLTSEGVAFKLWVEQPENIPTAVALKPYPRSRVVPLLKKYQLFK